MIFALHPRAVTASLFVIASIASVLVPLLVRTMPVAIPLSPFAGRWRIGLDFFERLGATRSTNQPVTGLVDTLEDLAHPGLSTADVHPALRAFFERTAAHDLFSRPHWHLVFRPFRPLVTLLCRNIAQFD